MWTGEHVMTFEDVARRCRRKWPAEPIVNAPRQLATDEEIHRQAESAALLGMELTSARVQAHRDRWLKLYMAGRQSKPRQRKRGKRNDPKLW